MSGVTDPPARRRSTRDRPAKPPLSEGALVEAALAVLRRDGLEAVTMRRVAKELDTGAASLYVYVDDHDALLRLLLDAVAGTIDIPVPDPARWREQLREFCIAMLEVLEAHNGIARVALSDVPTGSNAMACADAMLGLVLAGGVEPQRAAWACDALFLLITANAVETDLAQEREAAGAPVDYDEVHRTFLALPPERYPHLTAHAEAMSSGDKHERFRFAVDTLLDGLLAGSAVQDGSAGPNLGRRRRVEDAHE